MLISAQSCRLIDLLRILKYVSVVICTKISDILSKINSGGHTYKEVILKMEKKNE